MFTKSRKFAGNFEVENIQNFSDLYRRLKNPIQGYPQGFLQVSVKKNSSVYRKKIMSV
jgi:hypothetical protein